MSFMRYILDYKSTVLFSKQIIRERFVNGGYTVEEGRLSKFFFIERTLDPGSGVESTCLKCSLLLLQKKGKAIKRLEVEKNYISSVLKQHDIHYQEYGDNEHRVFLLNSGLNVYFHKHYQLPIYIVQRVELSNEEDRVFIFKIFPTKKAEW